MREPVDQDCPALPDLRKLRGNPAMVHCGLIDNDAAARIYDVLHGAGRLPSLDLILITRGGVASAAWRFALLLHEFTDRLTVLVPHRAWSAGTLVCLSAHELVFGPMAELSPLDPLIGAVNERVVPGEPHASPPRRSEGAGPSIVSAEDVRAFRDVAREWFGVDDPAARLQILALLSQRVSPLSLGAFFRADRFVRQVADELLALHHPDAGHRQDLVDRLVSGHHSHDHAITRQQARRLGLCVTDASVEEESLLWDIVKWCQSEMHRRDEVSSQVWADGIPENPVRRIRASE
jgi:Serine dehydrogenase proteinase